MSINDNINRVKQTLPENVKLVAVSKTKPDELILEAYQGGHRIFGENKAQELKNKYTELPKDIEWHFIGHLQTNKIKYIAPFVSLIHSVDSLKLLGEINKAGEKNNRVIDCLLQFHIAEEETKFGLDLDEAKALLDSPEYAAMKHVCIRGIMGMATFTDNQNQIRKEFKHLKEIFDQLKVSYFSDNELFKELSMGMSDDYPIAVDCGSTIVRIGSVIFGERNYK